MLTPQETFTQIKNHLLKQNEKSMAQDELDPDPDPLNWKGKCLYRGPNGLKCAAGIMIPDDFYKPEMDRGWPIKTVILRFDPLQENIQGDLQTMRGLQAIHDNVPPSLWPDDLKTYAQEHELVYD